ncbi:hypothetical protein [Pseudomonas aeruginosa]
MAGGFAYNYDSRYIERHAGPDLGILAGTEGIPPGGQLRVYPKG